MLVIGNIGEVETSALTLLGATSKEGDDSKIGFFGSGNKYAMAVLLRNNIPFTIYSGLKEIVVSTEEVDFKGQVYNRIVVDGVSTSLTTRMGPDWEAWFALREFICNAKDEGGFSLELGELTPKEGYTFIGVEETDETLDFYSNIDNYIITKEPILSVKTQYGMVNIHPKSPNLNIFRKGISVTHKNEHSSLFNYDLESIGINESRVYNSEWEVKRNVAAFYVAVNDEEIIQSLLNADDSFWEEGLYWGYCSTDFFSDAWSKLLSKKTLAAKSYREFMVTEDRFGVTFLDDDLANKLQEKFPTWDWVGRKSDFGWVEMEPESAAKEIINKAIAHLAYLGYVIESPIKYGKFLGENIVACFFRPTGEIRLSVEHIKDDKEQVLTLLEEHLHFKGYSDGSRAFEQFLMSEVVEAREALMTMKEKIVELVNEI